MFENPLIQFILEVLRALIVDELSVRVRRRVSRLIPFRSTPDYRRVIMGIHQRNRKRLLHRIFTALEEEP